MFLEEDWYELIPNNKIECQESTTANSSDHLGDIEENMSSRMEEEDHQQEMREYKMEEDQSDDGEEKIQIQEEEPRPKKDETQLRKQEKQYIDDLLSLDHEEDIKKINFFLDLFYKQAKKTHKKIQKKVHKKVAKQTNKNSTPKIIQHFWRDLKIKQKMISILQDFQEDKLIDKLHQMIEESERKKGPTNRNKEEDKWYIQLLKDSAYQPYLIKLFTKFNFQTLFAEKKAVHAQSYRHNRIPLLALVTQRLPYSEYRKFRDFYFRENHL